MMTRTCVLYATLYAVLCTRYTWACYNLFPQIISPGVYCDMSRKVRAWKAPGGTAPPPRGPIGARIDGAGSIGGSFGEYLAKILVDKGTQLVSTPEGRDAVVDAAKTVANFGLEKARKARAKPIAKTVSGPPDGMFGAGSTSGTGALVDMTKKANAEAAKNEDPERIVLLPGQASVGPAGRMSAVDRKRHDDMLVARAVKAELGDLRAREAAKVAAKREADKAAITGRGLVRDDKK